ncbi:nucleoside recognition protein [Lachnospiraceae bacterium 54-11]
MLNYIWAAMIVLGIIFGAINGNMKEVTEAALQSAGEAVSLCIATAGIMAFWVGLMEVAESSGLILRLTNMLSPFVSFMFPGLPKGHKAKDYISMNIIANVLGLGWACTPAGLKAMEELAKLEAERGTPGYADESGRRVASNEMCTFLILNISSLQLIPVNMIAYRSQYGSVNPAGIIAPAIVATFVSTAVAVVYCKIKNRKQR